jgi:hypothetical protein
MKSIATLDLQYAQRFYGFKGEAQGARNSIFSL